MSAPEAPQLKIAANLGLDELITERIARGESVVHLGFGESRLPLHPEIRARLMAGATWTEYGPVAGRRSPRAAVAGYFTRRGLPTDADDVVLAPGSKPLLLAIVAGTPGDVVLAKPAWVTYAPQARLMGRRVIDVPIPAAFGGVPDPDLLPDALVAARAQGANPRIMILTAPDNPTGTTADPESIRRLCEIAQAEDLLVISDEIYRDVLFDDAPEFISPAELIPGRAIVVTGLSKSLALGGWRIGAARFPDDEAGRALRQRVIGAASQIWSNASGPMQAVAEYAFSEPEEIVEHRRASTRLHQNVARAVHEAFASGGAEVRRPTGGFYVYPDFAPLAEPLRAIGVHDAGDLERFMLSELGIAVLGGHHCGDDISELRFRAATSLLYGSNDEERWESLRSDDPASLPHIASQIDKIRAAAPRIMELASQA